MQRERTQPNRNKLNMLVDSAIFIAFLVAMAPRFSGMAIHEWLGMAFGAPSSRAARRWPSAAYPERGACDW